MKGAVLLLLFAGVASAYVVGYHIEPVQAAWSGRVGYQPPNNKVSEFITCNFDSLSYVELFAGAIGNGGEYRVGVVLDGDEVMHSLGRTQTQSESWVRFDQWDHQVAFTKGKTYEVRFTRAWPESIQYYYDHNNPYSFGYMSGNGSELVPQTNNDLAARVYGRMNAVDSTYWGMDDWCFVPWWSQDSANRRSKRDSAADLAASAGVGTMMIYARWPELVGDNDTTLSWSEFDAHLWEVKRAQCRPVINITEVAKWASSRVDTFARPDTDTVFVAGYCAPLNLYEPVDSSSNYWAAYVRDLLLHTDTVPGRQWPNNRPGDVFHVVEIWNEPNDSCIDTSYHATGWWRRPKVQYTSGYGGPEGLCRLYVRMASVAESVIHHKGLTGHESDTILVGVPHRMLDSVPGYLISGIRWVRDCYQIATEPGGPGIFWDGISFHPYQKGVGFNPNTFEETAESVRTIARSFGDYDCQVWCTEVSVFTKRLDSMQYFQMRYLPQVYTIALASQALPGAGVDQCQWWSYSQINGWWPDSLGLIGLYTNNWTNDSVWSDGYWGKHSSFYAFRTLTEELTDHRLERRVLMDDSTEDSLMRVYEFSDPDANDKRVWVGWAVDTTAEGRTPVSVSAQAPVRTDSVVVRDSAGSETRHTADADGWFRSTLTRQVQYMTEVGTATRPELVAESLWLSPIWSGLWWIDTVHVRIKNRDPQESTPSGCPTWVRLTWNDSVVDSTCRTEAIGPNETVVESFVWHIPPAFHGDGLLAAHVNPGMRYVEREGTDDNQAYQRLVIRGAIGGTLAVTAPPGGKTDAPLLVCGLASMSYEKDSTGQEPADSARLVFTYWGQRDSMEHAADTTAWFPFRSDTAFTFPRGCGKYRVYAQYRDSGANDSPLYPDSTDSIAVFDSVPATGSVLINGGTRFTTSASCSLRLAAHDSASGVANMRFTNGPRVNLVQNGMFAGSASSWSFAGSGSGYDSTLQMAKLSVGSSQSSVRQFIPAESISAHSGDSCVLEANVMALMHGGNASGNVAFRYWKTRQDTSRHDTAWTLIDSAGYAGDLLSLTGRSNLSKHFLLTTPSAESGWSWRGGMVRVEAHGVDTAVGHVWTDDIALDVFHPQSGDAWFGSYDTLSQWDIGSGAGRHIVTALYRDSSGNENSATYADTIMLDPTPPVVHITLPSLGQMVNGTLEITGWAYDSVEVSGDSWFSARRLFYRKADSTNWRPVLPDSCSHTPAYPNWQHSNPAVHLGYWNTTPILNGQYWLKLTASDSAGHLSSCSTWVMVQHGRGGGMSRQGPSGGGTGLGEGSLYVGSADGTVLHLSNDLDSLGCWQVSDSGSQAYVTSVLEVGSDSVLVLDARNKRVHKLHRNGQGRRRLVSNLSLPMGLTRDDDGNFWLVDKGIHRIGKFRSNGTLVFTRGGLGTDSLHFHSPEAIAVKGSLVYVADTKNDRIVAYDTSGNYKMTITGDFASPTSVMVADSGAIYLTDGSDGMLKGITPLGGNIATIVSPDSDRLRGLIPSDNGHWLFTLAPQPNKIYKFQIQSDENLPGGVQSSGGVMLPKNLSFAQPFPNPARTRLNIAYALPRATRVSVRLYDVAGKLVTTLANGDQKPGYYNLTWNRQDAKGRSCACGIYFCTLAAENQRFSRKVILTE